MKTRHKILVTRKLPSLIEARLKELFECTLRGDDTPMTTEALKEQLPSYHGLVPTITDRINAEVLTSASSLKIIANFGAGVDHIDLKCAKEMNILVANTPDTLTDDSADMTMAMIVALARRILEGAKMVENKQWFGWSPTCMRGHRINGKRLGIVGMGRIGRALARRAYGFGMHIHYHNRNRLSQERERSCEASFWPELEDMLSHVDFVSVNCPYTEATHHLINKHRLKLMKPHSFLINTSRGDVIDQDALANALQEGEIAGAALDVYSKEPDIPEVLLHMPNVICLPHMASATMESRQEMGEQVLINLQAFFDRHRPPNRVIDLD